MIECFKASRTSAARRLEVYRSSAERKRRATALISETGGEELARALKSIQPVFIALTEYYVNALSIKFDSETYSQVSKSSL